MKVLFIIPDYENIWESLGIGYVAAYLKQNFRGKLELKCLHTRFHKGIVEEGINSDLVAFTSTSPTHQSAIQIARQIKRKRNVPIVFGGWHTSSGVSLEDCIDTAIKGEGELPFLDVVDGSPVIRYRKLNWNELPWPDRDLIYNKEMVDLCEQMTGKRITSFQSKRVCPFRCKMCGEKNITGLCSKSNPVRVRDPEDLLDEVDYVARKYRLDMFKFVDATWDTSAKDVIEFCQAKTKRGNKLPFEVMVHASLMTEEMMKWMSKANCYQIDVGVESGSQKVLNFIGKGTTPDKVRKVFEWGKKYKIRRRAFFILGMPNETKEDIKMTDKLAQELDAEITGFTILCPYPGTDLYRDEFQGVDWSKADEYSNDLWYTEHFTNKQLKAIQGRLVKKYQDRLPWHQKGV